MIQKFYNENKNNVDKITFICVFFLFIFLFVKVVYFYVAPFVFAYLFSLLLSPIVLYLNRQFKIPKTISSILLIFILFGLLMLLCNAVILKVCSEIGFIIKNRHEYISSATALWEDIKLRYKDIADAIPESAIGYVKMEFYNLTAGLAAFLGTGIKNGLINFIISIPEALITVFIFIVSTFFFTKDKLIINAAIKKHSPKWLKNGFMIVKTGMLTALWGYLKAQLLLMVIITSICVMGLLIMGFPYAFLIGISAGVIDALPAFGVGFFLYPMFAFNIISGNYTMAIGIAAIYFLVHFTRQMLEPKILGTQIGLHPLLTLMSIYLGLKTLGIIGLFIGPAAFVVCKIILTKGDNNINEPIDN